MNQLKIFNVGYPTRGPKGNEEVMLGEKQATDNAVALGIAGKRIGYGGKFEAQIDTTVEDGFIRELGQETEDQNERPQMSVARENVKWMARILVKSTVRKSLYLDYLLAYNCQGQPPAKTREIIDPKYFSRHALPKNILGDNLHILPSILDGQKLAGWVLYDGDMNVLKHDIKPVDSLDMTVFPSDS